MKLRKSRIDKMVFTAPRITASIDAKFSTGIPFTSKGTFFSFSDDIHINEGETFDQAVLRVWNKVAQQFIFQAFALGFGDKESLGPIIDPYITLLENEDKDIQQLINDIAKKEDEEKENEKEQ